MHDPPDRVASNGALKTDADLTTALAEHHRRISQHAAGREAADHLAAAARLLREVRGRDAILLGAPGAADVLSALRNAAPFDRAVAMLPPFDLRNAIHGLRKWPLQLDDDSPQRPQLDPATSTDH